MAGGEMEDLLEQLRVNRGILRDFTVDDGPSKLEDQSLLAAAYRLVLRPNSDYEDDDLIIPIGGKRRVGLYMPDTLLLEEVDLVVAELQKDGWVISVKQTESGFMQGYPQAEVWYAAKEADIVEAQSLLGRHAELGRMFGYKEDQLWRNE